MPCERHVIVCEGESEWTYLQRLQSFVDAQPLAAGQFEPPLSFIAPERVNVKNGSYTQLKRRYNETRAQNKRSSIHVWADFDLYHRNDNKCAELYAAKTGGIPDFKFSYHNFEDFFALHHDGEKFLAWRAFGAKGHFTVPLHAEGYLPEIRQIFTDYGKGELAPNFVNWQSLQNLKNNLQHRPKSNPLNLGGLGNFGAFLIGKMDTAYPGKLV